MDEALATVHERDFVHDDDLGFRLAKAGGWAYCFFDQFEAYAIGGVVICAVDVDAAECSEEFA